MIVISEYFENIYPLIFYFLTMPLVILLINFFKHFVLLKYIYSSKLRLFNIIAFIKITDFLKFSQLTIVFGANVIHNIDFKLVTC
jgi:hypothetical protein